MNRVLIIGAGAAGSVVAKKCLMNDDIFNDIHVASRTISKCESLKNACNDQITIHQLDADIVKDTVHLIREVNPAIVINMALPYQDLAIMDACLETKVHYLDTANYEPKDEARFSYHWQWDYDHKFKTKEIMALLGSGFDPGVTNVFIAYANKHFFDTIESVDIIDCNAGDHGHPFATNFNPEINIREITQPAKYYHNGEWVKIDALLESKLIDFPEVGERRAYLMYHEELESLVKHFPSIKKIRFWMTFSDDYLMYLNVLQTIGLTSINPVDFNGQSVVPLEFLKTLLPSPSELSENYTGKTCIGCRITGKKDGEYLTKLIVNVCDHQICHKEVHAQAVSYTTGVPAMIGAKMMLSGQWMADGVFNMEQLDPDPFMAELMVQGLPWSVMDCDGPLD